MSLYKSFCLVILFAIIIYFPYSIAAQEAISKAFLSSILTKEIENYQNKLIMVHYRQEWKRTTTHEERHQVKGGSYETVFQPGMFRKIIKTDYKDHSVKTASGVNSQYSFQIIDRNNGWDVEKFDFLKNENGAKNNLIRKNYKRMETPIKFLPYCLSFCNTGGTIDEIIQDKNFEILKSESFIENGKDYRKISYKYLEKDSYGVINNFTGSITFDPDLAWVIKYVEIDSLDEFGRKFNKTIMSEYEIQKDLPVLKSRNEHIVKIYFNNKLEEIMDLNHNFSIKLLDKPLPESEFTLSHFGLPVPTEPIPKPILPTKILDKPLPESEFELSHSGLPESMGINLSKPSTPLYVTIFRIGVGLAILSFCLFIAKRLLNENKKNRSI